VAMIADSMNTDAQPACNLLVRQTTSDHTHYLALT